MNVDQMRSIDSLVGTVVCALLTAYNRVHMHFGRAALKPEAVRKVLVTKYLGMGSILLATPMIRELRRRLPDSRVVLMTFENNAHFSESLGLFDEVVSIRTSSLASFAGDVLKAIVRNRREKFDVVLDLEFFARFSTIISFLSSAKMRVGYDLPKLWRGNLLTHPIHFNPYRHVTEIFSAQLEPLGIKVSDFSPTPPAIGREQLSRVMRTLAGRGVSEGEFLITVNVNASDLSRERRWPRENFVELIEHLSRARPDAWIILVGDRNEVPYVCELHAALSVIAQQRVLNFAGQFSIEEFIALISRSGIFITSDSGPLHIASALKVPTLAFFGPETPSLYGPFGEHNTILYAGIYCSPCLNVYNAKRAMCKGNNVCMKVLGVSEALAALEKQQVLKRR